MNPNLIHQRAKHFRSLDRELKQLRQEYLSAPKVKLDEPFHRGWERFFVLTNQALKRPDADKITTVLQHFQNHEYCRKGLFRNGRLLGRRWARGEVGKHHLRRPHFDTLIRDCFPRVLYPYLKARFLDFSHSICRVRDLKKHQRFERVTFRRPYLLKSHLQARIITHLPLHDPALEARIHKLETILWQTGP